MASRFTYGYFSERISTVRSRKGDGKLIGGKRPHRFYEPSYTKYDTNPRRMPLDDCDDKVGFVSAFEAEPRQQFTFASVGIYEGYLITADGKREDI